MKELIAHWLTQAVRQVAPEIDLPAVHVERCKDSQHGDFASNLALALAKPLKQSPRALAEALVAALPTDPLLSEVSIAGPGFINFRLSNQAQLAVVSRILEAGLAYGRSAIGQGQRVQVEFVSANPTGPLHIGHGRGAAYGAALADVLAAAGFQVEREYYVNDAGRQMDILALSVWLRSLQSLGQALVFPPNAYQGAYVRDIAAALVATAGASLLRPVAGTPLEVETPDDPEAHLDTLIQYAQTSLGAETYRQVHSAGLESILADIRADLAEFGIEFECWFSERSLTDSGAVDRVIERLIALDQVYRENGALWFRSTAFGDEKDRVVERENGQRTYFASDIAYHAEKFDRGFDRVINIWGADHHGYIPRVKAALQALGYDPERLEVQLVQFATLYRGGERAQMSTRSGQFVTLRELREEVGADAARYFYVMRRSDQHLDFDLDLACSQSSDNPVYYAQYAHARIQSVFRQFADGRGEFVPSSDPSVLALLQAAEEQVVLRELARYPEVVTQAAMAREPHQIANYLRELAAALHAWYNRHKFLDADQPVMEAARLSLAAATRQVLCNALRLLGVTAPERM